MKQQITDTNKTELNTQLYRLDFKRKRRFYGYQFFAIEISACGAMEAVEKANAILEDYGIVENIKLWEIRDLLAGNQT